MQADMDLAARYAKWETEDLARAATAQASEFTPDALTVMRQELERRGQVAGPEPLPATGATAAGVGPIGVGGLLRLFVFLLGMGSIEAMGGAPGVLDGSRGAASRLMAAAWGWTGAYGIVCCVLIMRRDRRAPGWAALWLVAVVVLSFVDSLHDYFVLGTFTSGFLSAILYCGIWLTYLSKSRRVRATFGTVASW